MTLQLLKYLHNSLFRPPGPRTMSILAVLIVAAFAAANAQPPIQIGDRPFSLIPYVVRRRLLVYPRATRVC